MSIPAKPQAIHVHIDSLVLCGPGHIDAAALDRALQEALSRELSSAPALRDAVLPRARATVALPARCDAVQLGGVLAQTLAGIAGAARQDVSGGRRHG